MNKIIYFVFIFFTCEAVAIGIDYTMMPKDGGGRGESYYINHSRSTDNLGYYHYTDIADCIPCKKLEYGKNDWYVQVGSDTIYGTYACSTIQGGEPTNAYRGPTFNSFYKISQSIQKDKIKNEDNGIYCYCRISKFNETSFNNSSWLWLGGGMSIYETDDWTALSSERKNNLMTACREHCAEDCFRAMKDYEFRSQIYKTAGMEDTGTNCITGIVYDQRESEKIIWSGMQIYADEKETRTDGSGKFRLCGIQGNEVFRILIGPPVLICDLVIDEGLNITDHINNDSVINFKMDCSNAIEKETEKNCTDSGGEYKDGKCECDSETLHLKPHTLDKTRCQCEDINKKFDLTEKICKEKDSTDISEDNISLETGNSDTNTTSVNAEISTTTDDTADITTNNIPTVNPVKEAEDAYKKAKENEQSFANLALTATSTAATGLGAMTVASAIAEQNADAAAEKQMRAYIETMKCEYGAGQNVKLGNEDVTLPGGNELLEYFTEYKEIAERLKQTKTALGLRSGIEAEVLYDRAQSGLYQYANIGKTGGGETSLYRALTDETGTDAARWNEQKESAAKKKNVGAAVAGTGAIGGAAGNLIINKDKYFSGEDSEK